MSETLRRLQEVYKIAGDSLFSSRILPINYSNVTRNQNYISRMTERITSQALVTRKKLTNENYNSAIKKGMEMSVKDAATKLSRDKNISIFLKNFINFYTSEYKEIRSVCVDEEILSNSVSYSLPNSNEFKAQSHATGNRSMKAFTVPGLKDIPFKNNGIPFNKSMDKNVLIIGAGPIGLYMAGLLKCCSPSLNVNVVEPRVSTDKIRHLTRTSAILTKHCKIDNVYLSINKLTDFFHKVCPLLQTLLFKDDSKPTIHLLNHVFKNIDMDSIAIGYLEFLLANFAQKCGVIIYHDPELGSLEKIEEAYTNTNTRFVFDATGGRLIPVDPARFPVIGTSSIRVGNEIRHRLQLEGTTGKNFNIKEGFLKPDEAVFKRNNYIYLAIGDTFMKTDYRQSRAISFGSSISLALILVILRELQDERVGGSRKNKSMTRKKRSP